MTLSDNIHQLANEHMSQATDGSFGLMPALLDQLHKACTSNFGAAGGGTGGSGLVVNSGAVKLQTTIQEDALFEHFEYAGEEYQGSLKDLLRTWPSATNPEITNHLEHVTHDWVTEIQTLITPRRPPWRPTLNCPSCGDRFHGPEREPNLWVEYWDHDTEEMAHPSQWTAGCEGCGAQWAGDKLKWLPAATRPTETTLATTKTTC